MTPFKYRLHVIAAWKHQLLVLERSKWACLFKRVPAFCGFRGPDVKNAAHQFEAPAAERPASQKRRGDDQTGAFTCRNCRAHLRATQTSARGGWGGNFWLRLQGWLVGSHMGVSFLGTPCPPHLKWWFSFSKPQKRGTLKQKGMSASSASYCYQSLGHPLAGQQ